MVDTIKFSQMTSGGDIANDDKVPGLKGGGNVLFNNPWTFLPPGTTAQRPAPSAATNYRLRFNTEEQLYEYYDAILGAWTQLQESAFTQGPFVIYTADASIPDGQNLGALSNGILKQTITLGSATLDIAVNGTDFYGPGFTGNLQSPSGVADSLGNPVLTFFYQVSPGNYLTISNAQSGNNAGISNDNSVDTNPDWQLTAKGTGSIILASRTGDQPVKIVNLANGINAALDTSLMSSGQFYQFPDQSGTFALTSDITGFVTSVSGTANRITSTGGTAPVIDISASYVGQSSITTLGTITTGVWNAGAITSSGSITATGGPLVSGSAAGGNAYLNAFSQTAGNGQLQIAMATSSGDFVGLLTTVSLGAARTWNLPDASGNIALTSQIPTGAALTKTDDTNVTLTLGGSASTALVNAASLTLGWTGTLSGTRGGTGVNNGSNTATFAGNLNFANSFTTSGNFAVTQTYTGITNVTFPTSGTLATTSQLVTPAALTKTDDTNVTLTLGGSPSTALVNAASLTLGWTGQLGLTRGGTAASLTASNGGIVYSNASSLAILAGTATANLPLLSGSSTTPSWGAFALNLGGALTTAGALTLSGAFGATFTFTNTTGVTFPTSGTLATTSQLPTPSALTKTDDTNVTLTLGGTPATALLQATSLTLGWTGTLALTRGGTGASTAAGAKQNLNITYFSAHLSADTTNSTGDGTQFVIPFNTADTNVGGGFNTGTGIFTAQQTGLHQFFGIVAYKSLGATTGAFAEFLVNSTDYFIFTNDGMLTVASSGNYNVNGSLLVYLTANDTVKINAAASGTTKTVGFNAAYCRFAGYFIGA